MIKQHNPSLNKGQSAYIYYIKIRHPCRNCGSFLFLKCSDAYRLCKTIYSNKYVFYMNPEDDQLLKVETLENV